MKTLRRIGKASFVTAALVATIVGASTVLAPRAEAIPVLLCGPTYLWACSGPGGPDILFAGTVCERMRFEARTGYTCVPYSG